MMYVRQPLFITTDEKSNKNISVCKKCLKNR